MVSVQIDPFAQPTVLTMGLGSVVVGHLSHDGMPGLYFCPAAKPGINDTDAAAEVAGKLAPSNAIVIRFATMDAVLAHLDRVKAMIAAFEAEKRPSPAPTEEG